MDVKDYFAKLDENENLARHNGFIVEDGKLVHPSDMRCIGLYEITKYHIKGLECYAKKFKSDDRAFNEIVLPKMYNSCGINAVNVYPAYLSFGAGSPNDEIVGNQDCRFLLSQDVSTVGLYVESAQDVIERFIRNNSDLYLTNRSRLENHMFYLFNNSDVRERLLAIMTQNCIEQVESLFTCAVLNTAWDTNQGNYFFYKETPNAERFDGLILLDNEHLLTDKWCHITTKINKPVKEWIVEFVQWSEFMEGFLGEGLTTVGRNILRLKELIQAGKLTNNQIDVIKRLLKFDIEKEAQSFKSQYQTINVSARKIDFMKYLAEYNRNELESEI